MNQRKLIERLAAGNDLFAFNLKHSGPKPSEGKVRRDRENARKPATWGEFDIFVMAEAKAACKRRQAQTGIEWHVDHLIPLECGGAHAWFNIQVIPAWLNQWKGTRMVLTKPGEWIRMMESNNLRLF